MDICSLAAQIEGNIKKGIDYCELEKSVGYSYHHIRGFFKQIVNISLSRYILARKICNSAFEIRHSKKNMTEIAFDYSFSDFGTFTRAFRRITGMTPSDFKHSEYLCGRKVICPGVYAPVILNHANPMLTLQHIREVNELGEMKKTTDSCVLYSVPKVYFNRSVGGQIQKTPFPMCLQSVLNYMGQNISYTQLMAYSGAAFRMRWDIKGGFAPWVVDITQTYYEPDEPFIRAFKAAGRKYVILDEREKDSYINLIKSELDCGRPVIALGVVGPPEACIVTGYRDNGKTLLGWSLFQDWENVGKDESGYFIKENWLENTETVMAVAEEAIEPLSAMEVLRNALMLMTQNEVNYSWSESPSNYGGQAAYEAWAKAMENDDNYNKGSDFIFIRDCQNDAIKMLGEGRIHAALYVESVVDELPQYAKMLTECAAHLKSAADCASGMVLNTGDTKEYFSKENRMEIAKLIRKAAKYEKQACVILAKILG